MKMTPIELLLSLLLLLRVSFGINDSHIIFEGDEAEDDDEDKYLFVAEKNIPLETSCRQLPNSGTVDYAFQMAVKNFLFDVKQETIKPNLISFNDSSPELEISEIPEVSVQRCSRRIAADGNCLFRSLSYCLHKDERFYSIIRREIVNYVVENWEEEYKIFVVDGDIYEKKLDSVEEYRRYMSKDSTWGGYVELMAARKLYGFRVRLYSRTGISSMGDPEHPFIALYYSGDGYFGHYYVVEDVPLPNLAEPTKYTIDDLPNVPVKRYTSPRYSFSTKVSPLEDSPKTSNGINETLPRLSSSNITNPFEEPIKFSGSTPLLPTLPSMEPVWDTSTKNLAPKRHGLFGDKNWPMFFREKPKSRQVGMTSYDQNGREFL